MTLDIINSLAWPISTLFLCGCATYLIESWRRVFAWRNDLRAEFCEIRRTLADIPALSDRLGAAELSGVNLVRNFEAHIAKLGDQRDVTEKAIRLLGEQLHAAVDAMNTRQAAGFMQAPSFHPKGFKP